MTHYLHDPQHASLCLIVSYASGIVCNTLQGPSSGQSPDFVWFSFQNSGLGTGLHGSYGGSLPAGANTIKNFIQTARLTG